MVAGGKIATNFWAELENEIKCISR